MKKANVFKLSNKIIAIIIATIMVAASLPLSSFVTAAEPIITPGQLDGGFENATLGETPDGWSLVVAKMSAAIEDNITNDWTKNYTLTVQNGGRTGNKNLVLEPKNASGTFGYVLAQSPKIKVEGGTGYSFNYSLKISGASNASDFFGGRMYVYQYDKNDKLIKSALMGEYIRENIDWNDFTKYIQTETSTASVRFYMFMGGTRDKNAGLKIQMDDITLEKFSDKALLNGDFEAGNKNDLYSWHLTSKTIKNETNNYNYDRDYILKQESNGYHGNCASLEKKGAGYVTLDSNMIKVTEGATYFLDYALKITGAGATFQGVRAIIGEYDASRKLIQTVNLNDLIKVNTDWKEYSVSYTPTKNVKYIQLEFFAGDYGGAATTFKVYFDDIRLKVIERNNQNDAVNNSGFEEVYNGIIFDWSLSNRDAATKIEPTFEGYNGTKGIKITRKNTTAHNYAVVQSNKFEVTAGTKYKATYMAKMSNRVGNCYIVLNAVFYGADGKKIEHQREQYLDFKNDSEAWQQMRGYFTAPKGAATCQLEFLVCGTNYICWMDDVYWCKMTEADTYGFEEGMTNNNPTGWVSTEPAKVKLDNTVFREGKTSLFVSTTLNTQVTQIVSDQMIPVNRESRYIFNAYVKSYSCDTETNNVLLRLLTYDKDGKLITRIEGLREILNDAESPSNWQELICSLATGMNVCYVRPYIEFAPGTVNAWVDDIKWRLYDTNDEYLEDFDSIRDDGKPDGWETEAVEGEPIIEAKDSIVTIKAESSSDVGLIRTRWNTAKEYTAFTFTTTYSATPGMDMKVAIKFYDYADREIVSERVEKTLEATGGEFKDYSFDFVLPAVKHATIEISNDGDGTLMIKGLKIVRNTDKKFEDTEKGEGDLTWRGKWVWHNENVPDSVYSTPRYFRYHVSVPDKVAAGTLQITADDNLRVWINGIELEDDSFKEHWENIAVFDNLEEYFVAGDNVIAVSVVNFTSYAGLLFDGYVETEEGAWVDFYSTEAVVSSLKEYEGWYEKNFDDSKWGNTKIIETWGGPQWGTQALFDASAIVKNAFEIVDYTVTEDVVAGEDVTLTMTIIPEIDFETKLNLSAQLWVRNSQQKIFKTALRHISGPATNEWKAGEEITVTYAFEIMDFIGTGRYNIQLNVNQVKVTNEDIVNNRLIKAIRVTNEIKPIKSEIVDLNGTKAFSINGDIHPIMSFTVPNTTTYQPSTVPGYMHDAGICITRACVFPSAAAIWTGNNEYDFSVVDSYIYALLADHPDTYIVLSPDLDVPNWWMEQNPDELVLTSEGDHPGVSFASDRFIEDATKTNIAVLEHMMQQPYWSRVVGAALCGARTSEWLWYGGGQFSIDHSVAGQNSFKKWVAEKYGTDAELRKAWGNKNITLDTVKVPTFEERAGDKYATLLSPETQQDVLDYVDYLGDIVATRLMDFTAAVTETVNDSIFIGSYYGYLIQRAYYYDSTSVIHTAMDRVMKDDNIDFIAAPVMYGERYDGEALGFMHMVNGVLANGKALIMEDDLRVCSWENLTSNFFTRNEVGPTYTMSNSISQMERSFSAEITNNVGNWFFDLGGSWFNREEFSDVIEIMHNEATLNLYTEKDCKDEICFIIDEDMYENMAYDFYGNFDVFYWLILEQRYEMGRMGLPYDSYSMSDLKNGIVPDYKVYLMFSPVEMDEAERKAVDKYLKNGNKTVVWQYMAGVSDRNTLSAENMSEVIGIDVTLDTTRRSLEATVNNKEHWLTKGLNGRFYGVSASRDKVSPTAFITDNSVETLATLSYDTTKSVLAVKEFDDWTSIFSSVVNLPMAMLRNILNKVGAHIYSTNPNDVIYANSNYVAINTAHGGEREIKLKGNYSVYDVFGQTTYSLNTDTIKVTMEDKSTKLYRLVPVEKHLVFVKTDSKVTATNAGYNLLADDTDFSTTFTAAEGYLLTGISIDGEYQEIFDTTYTVDFDDLDNSHFVKAHYKKMNMAEKEALETKNLTTTIIIIVSAVVVLVAIAVVIILLLKKKRSQEEQ